MEVENITSTLGDKVGSYEFEGKKYDSYFVTCEWTYKNEDTFKDISTKSGDGFVKKEYFTIIENDGRFEIVQAYGDN